MQNAARLSPLDPLGHMITFAFGVTHVLANRNEEGIEWLDRALAQKPDFLQAMIVTAEACGRLGRREEGRECVDRVLKLSPDTTVKSFSDFLSEYYCASAERRPVF